MVCLISVTAAIAVSGGACSTRRDTEFGDTGEPGSTGPSPTRFCGNGVVEPGEDCEPPNRYSCDAYCHWYYCFGPGTLVATPEGDRPIERVAEGDVVWSWNEHEAIAVARRVVAVHRAHVRTSYELRTESARLASVTPTHPLYLPDEQRYAPVREIRQGLRLLVIAPSEQQSPQAPHCREEPLLDIKVTERPAPTFEVYHLSVEGPEHNFFADGVLAHNKQPDPTTTGGSWSGGVGGGCAAEVYQASQRPLGMYMMLDTSASMGDSVGTETKWSAVTSALKSFIVQPSVADVSAGIQYFPLPPAGPMCPTSCTGPLDCCTPNCVAGTCVDDLGNDSCDPADYATPAVPIAPLPGIANSIQSSLDSITPNGGTPATASLQGGIDYTRNWAILNPTHTAILVYMMDGDPQQCDTNLQTLYGIAAAGYNGTPSIPTYVIGIGSPLSSVQGIAMAGGSEQPYLVEAGPNTSQQFLDAMNAIHRKAIGCSYVIPVPAMGMLDPSLVNLQYTPGAGFPVIFGHVAVESDCLPGSNAWYYDNDAMPAQIVLCPDACNLVMADGKIEIVFGCPTIPF